MSNQPNFETESDKGGAAVIGVSYAGAGFVRLKGTDSTGGHTVDLISDGSPHVAFDGIPILGVQQPAIPDTSDFRTAHTETINLMLAAMRAHGLIAKE